MKTGRRLATLIAVVTVLAASGLVSAQEAAAQERTQVEACFGPVADTYVTSQDPDGTFGQETELRVAWWEGSYQSRSYLRFDLSSIPTNANLESATLELYMNYSELEPLSTVIAPAAESWQEDELTWNTRPGGLSVYSAGSHGRAEGWKTWDVTALAQDWISGTLANDGLIVRAEVPSTGAGFAAEEGSDDRWPRLCVTYSAPLLSGSEAADRADEEERLEPELLESDPSAAELAYLINDFTGELEPGYWLVLLGDQESPAGLAGLDPFTGELQFETMVTGSYQFPQIDPARVQQDLNEQVINPDDYLLDEAKFTFIGGGLIAEGNYWLVPHESGELGASLAFPAFEGGVSRIRKSLERVEVLPWFTSEGGRPYYQLGEGLLQQAQTGYQGEVGGTEARPGGRSTPRVPGDWSEAGIEKARQEAASETGATPATSASKALLQDVPVFSQGDTPGCGVFALSMAHQWWSPVDLGIPRDQAYEITQYQGDPGDYGPNLPRHVKDVMDNWDQVDGSYEDFRTTTGRRGSLSDVKFWIDQRQTPVLVFVNSDVRTVGFFDHWVLATGFDDGKNKLHLNNSGAAVGTSNYGTGTVDYGQFTNSYWTGWGGPNHYLAAGEPGDRDVLSVSPLAPQTTGDIEDDEQEQVGNLGLSIGNDDAQEGADSFGDGGGRYATEVVVRYLQGEGLFQSIQEGAFEAHSLAPRDAISFTHTSGLNQGQTVGALTPAEVYLDPGNISPDVSSLGTNEIEIEYYGYDEDDRFHGSETIKVFHYVAGGGCNKDNPKKTPRACYNRVDMPKPVLRRSSRRKTRSFEVTDDDPDGPAVSDFDPSDGASIQDDHSGSISLRAEVGDPFARFWLNVAEVRFSYRVYDAAGVRVVSETKTIVPQQNDVQPYAFDVPRNHWSQGMVGGTIRWSVEADDTDDDRPGDGSTTSSGQLTIHLEDDDTEGPEVTDHEDEVEVITVNQQRKARFTLKAQLDDDTGVLDNDAYPAFYYRWNDSLVSEEFKDGVLVASSDNGWFTATFTTSFDHLSDTLYWRVKARDTDTDRSPSVDQETRWSSTFEGEYPAEFCMTPASLDHDFGVLSNDPQGQSTAAWVFTVGNCGGSSLTAWGSVSQKLQSQTGSTPVCKQDPGHCWLGLSGLPDAGSGGQTLYGGEEQTVTVTLNTTGLGPSVPILNPGEYEGAIEVSWGSGSDSGMMTGTIDAAIPQITVTAPKKGAAWEPGDTHTITWQSMYVPSGTDVMLAIIGPDSEMIDPSASNTGSYRWTVPAAGLQDGQYRVTVNPVGLPTMVGRSEPFWIGNAPPDRPTNQSPPHGASGISSTPTLTASTFSDPNAGDTQQAAQWQIRSDTLGTSQYSNPRWDSGPDTQQLRSATVPTGVLPSRAAAATEVTIVADEYHFRPDHVQVSRGQLVTLTLKNVGSVSHTLYIPELEVSVPLVAPGGRATVTFTPDRVGEFSFYCTVANHQQLGMVGRVEATESVFWWRVRHEDNHGGWSPWSDETRFSTVYEPPMSLPGGLLDFGDVVADFRRFDDLTVTYNPLGRDDLGLGGGGGADAAGSQADEPLRYGGVAFDLTARDEGGDLVTELDDVYTLTLRYEDWQWQNHGVAAESTLNLYWNTGPGWEPILPCDGCSHDRAEDVVVARLDHLTQFALLGKPTASVYVPLVIRER